VDVQEAIGSRRTYRYLLPHKPVEREKIQKMLEAARIASFWGNVQALRAVVVERENATPEVLESLMAPVAGFQIEQAPVVIVWYLDFSALDVQGDRLHELMEARVMGVDLQKAKEMLDNVLIPFFKDAMPAIRVSGLTEFDCGQGVAQATLVAVDIVGRVRPDTPDRTRITVGRFTAVGVMLLAMVWSTQGDKFTSIFEAINKIPLAFAPAITCVFVFGVFWPRGTKQASLAAMATGFVLGSIDLVLDIPLIGDTRVISDVWGIPFMQQAWWLFVACSVVYVGVSLVTPAPSREHIEDLCWTSPKAVFAGRFEGLSDPRLLAGALCLLMVVMYWLLR